MSDARKHLLVLIWTKHICKGCSFRALCDFPLAVAGSMDIQVGMTSFHFSAAAGSSSFSWAGNSLACRWIPFMDLPPELCSCAHDGQTGLAQQHLPSKVAVLCCAAWLRCRNRGMHCPWRKMPALGRAWMESLLNAHVGTRRSVSLQLWQWGSGLSPVPTPRAPWQAWELPLRQIDHPAPSSN